MSSTEFTTDQVGHEDEHDHHHHHDPDGEPYPWSDAKRYLWILGIIPAAGLFLSIPFVIGFNHLGWGVPANAAWFLLPFLVFVVIPIGDMAIGRDGDNPPDEIIDRLEADPYYRWCTYLYIPFQYGSLILACYLWTADDLSWLGYDGGLGIVASLGVAWSVGITGGIGINTAHELGHKIDNSEKWLSKVTLATTGYGHFFIEHNRGHHARVATPEDPASSRFGEPFYRFLPRSVAGSFRSAWHLESERLRRLGKSPWTIRNDNINAWLMTLVLFGALIAVFGWSVAPWLIVQAVYGFCLLEVVNYLEHYGLLRQKTARGRYQRCRAEHSWNSDHLVTNIFLYHLQRHSDHHANPMKRYQTLRTVDEAPQLPAGYATMILVAYCPPLWRRIMDTRVLAHYGGDITKANIQPSRREKILARHGAGTAVVDAEAPTTPIRDTDAEAAAGRTSATGVYACPNCGHHYSEAVGEPREGFPAGTLWSQLPDDWRCPDCGVREKIDYLPVN